MGAACLQCPHRKSANSTNVMGAFDGPLAGASSTSKDLSLPQSGPITWLERKPRISSAVAPADAARTMTRLRWPDMGHSGLLSRHPAKVRGDVQLQNSSEATRSNV